MIRELVLGLVLLLFVKPILGPIAYAAVLSVVLYPIYQKHKKKYFAAFLVLVSLILMIYIGYQVTLKLFDQITWLSEIYNRLSPEEQIQLIEFSSTLPIQDYAFRVARSIPSIAVGLVLFVAFSYFFLVDGWRLKKVIYGFLPKEKAAKFVSEGWRNLNSIVGGFFVAMFVYIFISTALLYFTNSPSPLVLSVIAAIFGILPVLAAWMIYAYPVYTHLVAGNYANAMILVVFQSLWVTVVDFWFKAKYRGTLHPAVLIGSIVAGIYYFGFSGILVGPLLFTAIKTVASVERYRIEPVDVISEDLL